MRTRLKIILVLGIIVFSVLPFVAEAKSSQWTSTPSVRLFYCWGNVNFSNATQPLYPCATFQDGGGLDWSRAIENPAMTVTYDVSVVNNSTGATIAENTSVPVGTVIKLQFTPYASSQISWVGTGYSQDSPNGVWVAGAAAPTLDCSTSFVNNVSYPSANTTLSIYIPFSVSPPTKSITNTTNLSCGAPDSNGNEVCTVTAAGAINPSFNYGATTGKFYYRYYYPSYPACMGNNQPLSTASASFFYNGADGSVPDWYVSTGASLTDYVVSIPSKSVSYAITGVSSNNPPSVPTISGATSGDTCGASSYTYTFSATDPEGNQIKYGIDWDNNGTVDEWVPASGLVNSGTAQSTSHSWSTSGTKTFKVLAQDSNGAASAWSAAYNVTISTCPTPTALLTSSPTSIANGGSTTLTWSSTNTTSCSIDNGVGAVSPASGGTKSVSPVTTTTYTLTCNGPGGTASDSEVVTVLPPIAASCSVSPSSGTPSTSAPLTITYIQGSATTSTQSVTSMPWAFPSNNTAGNYIVVALSEDTTGGAPTITMSDTQGNAYTQASIGNDTTNNQGMSIYYASNIKAGANTVTATFSKTTPYRRMAIQEYSNISGLDVVATNVNNAGSAATDGVTSNANSTTANGDLIFGVATPDGGATTMAHGTAFTTRQTLSNLLTEDKIQASSGSVAATETFGTARSYLAQMAAFKPVVSGSGGTTFVWTALASGGTGSYTYNWGGTDGLSGSASTISKGYSLTGTKVGSTTVTSGGLSQTVNCSNSAVVSNSPTATLSAAPTTIVKGQSTLLSYSSSNVDTCSIDQGIGSVPAGTSGSVSVSPTASTTYTLICNNTSAGTNASQSIPVTVNIPLADISSSKIRVVKGNTTTISWSASNVTSCSVSGPGLSSAALSGSQSVTVNSQSTYTISCSSAGGPLKDSVVVNLPPGFIEF